jgi:hypothetical protein
MPSSPISAASPLAMAAIPNSAADKNVDAKLAELEKECRERPRLLVEAPTQFLNQEFANLPPGVHLGPGRIIVEFTSPQHALEKLLALAMAISNDFERFERQVHSS